MRRNFIIKFRTLTVEWREFLYQNESSFSRWNWTMHVHVRDQLKQSFVVQFVVVSSISYISNFLRLISYLAFFFFCYMFELYCCLIPPLYGTILPSPRHVVQYGIYMFTFTSSFRDQTHPKMNNTISDSIQYYVTWPLGPEVWILCNISVLSFLVASL